MKDPFFQYCSYSETIRQMPQNYMLTYRYQRRWIIDFDGAAQNEFLYILVDLLQEYESHYVLTAEQLAEKANKRLQERKTLKYRVQFALKLIKVQRSKKECHVKITN